MVKRLSERAEFWIILLIAYGYPFIAGVQNLWNARAVVVDESTAPVRMTDADLWRIVVFEVVAGALILGLLRARGMTWAKLRPAVSWQDTLRGVGVFCGSIGAMWLAFAFAAFLPAAGDRLANVPVEAAFGLAAAACVAIVNPLFEEAINLAFIQTRLREHGAAFAIGSALLARLLANLGEGPHALVGILPIGLLFGLYHWRTGRLWPVVVAHAMIEGIGLYLVSHAPVAG